MAGGPLERRCYIGLLDGLARLIGGVMLLIFAAALIG